MTTYNLITVRRNQTAGVEPIVADTEEKAIAYAAGMLSERVKGHEAMFMASGVRWYIDCGDRDLLDEALGDEQMGAFDLEQVHGRVIARWSPKANG